MTNRIENYGNIFFNFLNDRDYITVEKKNF